MGRAVRAGGRRMPVWSARPALAVAWRSSGIADYLPLLDRSGLGPSFPAWPIRCRAFRPCGASLASPTTRATMPSADFCRGINKPCGVLSPGTSGTRGRSPEVSSTVFDARPPDLRRASLMDMGFAVTCPLARRPAPRIRFLYISPRLCLALPSDPASRRRPWVRLSFTSIRLDRDSHPELSNMLGAHERSFGLPQDDSLARVRVPSTPPATHPRADG
jgi:hypothetical protein